MTRRVIRGGRSSTIRDHPWAQYRNCYTWLLYLAFRLRNITCLSLLPGPSRWKRSMLTPGAAETCREATENVWLLIHVKFTGNKTFPCLLFSRPVRNHLLTLLTVLTDGFCDRTLNCDKGCNERRSNALRKH